MESTLTRPDLRTDASVMRAGVVVEPGRTRVERRPIVHPGPQQVRIRVEGCGVCGSNLPIWDGRDWFDYPLEPGMPGHEGWGVVDQVGEEVVDLVPGDRVAFLSNHAFAEYDLADRGSIVRLPDELRDRPFPGEPLGCVMNVFRRADIRPGQTIAVIGIGFLGAMLVQLASRSGARVIAISRRPYALDVARALGADEVIPMKDHHAIIEEVRALTDGSFCDRTIEAVGLQWPLDLAGELTAERGRLVIAGFHQDGLRSVNVQLWNWRGLDVINAHERDPSAYVEGMEEAVEAVVEKRMDPFPLFTHTLALDDLGSALDLLKIRPDGFMKALVVTK